MTFQDAESNGAIAMVLRAEQMVLDRLTSRIIEHIAARIDAELREGLPTQAPSSDQHAIALLKEQAAKHQASAEALKRAAERLRSKGDSVGANQVYQSYLMARGFVTELIGEDA